MDSYFYKFVSCLFLREEYKINFYNSFLVKFFRSFYVVGLLLLIVFECLVFLLNIVSNGYLDFIFYFLFFLIFLFLLVPVFYVFRFFACNIYSDVNFRFKIAEELRSFILGNKFVDEKLNYYPTVFFCFDDEFLRVRFRLDTHVVTKKFRDLGEQLSSLFVLPLVCCDEFKGYMVYEFRLKEVKRENISSIIESDEIRFIKDSVVLNDELVWDFRKCPHGLITGITGSGKTYLFAYFIVVFLKLKAVFKIVDPKRADLYYLNKYFGSDVVFEKNQALRVLRESCELIDSRMEGFQKRNDYKWGEDYSFYGVKPYFLIFDEVAAFAASLKGKDRQQYEDNLIKIIMEGRQAGVFVILAMQRPDIEFIPGSVRDQLGLRIALGNMSSVGYKMVFGDYGKDLRLENKSAGFYMDLKMHSPKEFYTPYLDINFIDTLEKLIEKGKTILDKRVD